MNPKPERAPEWQEEFHPSTGAYVAATGLVASVYVYFLIFAQFGFLRALTTVLGEGHAWFRPVLLVMAVAGIGGGFGAARLFTERRGRALIMAGLVLAGLAVALTWVAATPELFLLAAFLTGAGTGIVTVTLAGLLRREIGGARLGYCIGLATGLAYAVCNLPPVFRGDIKTQLLVAIGAVCAGLVAVQGLEQRAPHQTIDGIDYGPVGRWVWVAVFLVLVATDSAVFYVIQHTPELKQATWEVGTQLCLNAAAHLAGAVLAGLALDRRHVAGTLFVAAVLLAGASLLLGLGIVNGVVATLYAAAVSGYSTALVFYPARSGRPALAAILFSVAGWLGSGLGLGLAERLHRIPVWLPLAAVVIIAALLAARPRK